MTEEKRLAKTRKRNQRRNAARRRATGLPLNVGTNTRGYRLHDARIDYSGGEGSIRTVKVELLNPDNTKSHPGRGIGVQGEVADAVFSDYRWLYGPMNLDDYLDDPDRHSFLGLWRKAVCKGVVMSNTCEREYADLVGASPESLLFDSIDEQLRSKLDKKKWVEWFPKDVRPKSGTAASVEKKLTELFKDDVDLHSPPLKAIVERWNQEAWAPKSQRNTPDFRRSLFGLPPAADVSEPKLFWLVDPGCPDLSKEEPTLALDGVIDYWRDKTGQQQVGRLLGVGENGNHLSNGLLGDFFEFLLDEKSIDDKVCLLSERFSFSASQRTEIARRLEDLRSYARALPAHPKLVESWKDYRGDMTAKLASWYTNLESKGKVAIDDTWGKESVNKQTGEVSRTRGLVAQLARLQKELPAECSVCEVVAETLEFIGDVKTRVDRAFTQQLEARLGVLRDELNVWVQKQAAVLEADESLDQRAFSAADKKLDKFRTLQQSIPRRVQSSPLFWGEDKRQLWSTLVSLKGRVRSEIDCLQRQMEQVSPRADVLVADRQVDQLANLHNRLAKGGHPDVQSRLSGIEKALGLGAPGAASFRDRTGNRRFYLSGRERSTYKKLVVPQLISLATLRQLADLDPLWRKCQESPQEPGLLRDTVQLSKVVNSALAAGAERKFQVELVTRHSTLDGLAKYILRSEFISRATIQATNGNQNLLTTTSGDRPRRYAYVFPQLQVSSPVVVPAESLSVAKEGNVGLAEDFWDKAKQRSQDPYLVVASSRHQVQFFDWFFGDHKSKACDLRAGGSFTIAERSLTVDWSGELPKVSLGKDPRVFVAQPFTLVPVPRQRHDRSGTRFVGVDVGEYGLAYSVWEFGPGYLTDTSCDPTKARCLASGFLSEPGQRIIKDAASQRRESFAMRTFTSPDTYLARLRADVVSSYQAQLEQVALLYDAQLVFEFEISAFESGGNRVKRIYDALKRSSIYGRTAAERTDAEQHWGKIKQKSADQRIPWAAAVSAWMTSQTCSACGRLYVEAYSDLGPRRTVDPECAGTVRVLDGQAITERTVGPGTTFASEGARKQFELGVHRAMRPQFKMPDGRVTASAQALVDALQRRGTLDDGRGFGSLAITTADQIVDFEARRGRSAIYICPYVDCLHIADADLQASFNIAIRGLIDFTVGPAEGDEEAKQKRRERQSALLRRWRSAILKNRTLCGDPETSSG